MLTPRLVSQMDARMFQYELSDTLPSNGSSNGLPQKQIQSGFHFWAEQLNIAYTTLNDAGADDGVCRFTAEFQSGSNQIGLSNGIIDLSTIAVPGRQRAIGVAGDPSLGLGVTGFPWFYLYESGGTIKVQLGKIGTTVETIHFVWTGWLIPTDTVPTAQAFYAMLANEFPEYGNMVAQR